jgi:uncharacterized membrane protein YagU involved in acid resistance
VWRESFLKGAMNVNREICQDVFSRGTKQFVQSRTRSGTSWWIAHYTIGVVFALVFLVLTSDDWLARPTLLPALFYGIATVVFPFFIMQPSFGLGIAASNTPEPMRARLKSVMTHTVFGVGLYVCALGVSYILRVSA